MAGVSDGERAAASGYWNQYGVGAMLVLAALRKYDLQWIRVADPEAGRVDDLQIARTARLDAYQIKWQQYAGTLTLNELVKPQGSSRAKPPLIAQLADGWSRLRLQHSHRRVVVHLVTDAFASTSPGILPEIKNPPTPYHFAAFIEQAWKPAKNIGEINFDSNWQAVWRELQTSSGLNQDEFSSFVQDCMLDLRTPAPPKDEDHRAIAELLFAIAAGPERIVELDRTELLSRLGWRRRYEYRNPHEFDVPRFYRPITSTVNELGKRLSELPGGYISVIGPPGSGKSTLLTRTLQGLMVRLIRYYAYVPEAQDPTVLRGESINFLHDVTLRLDEAGLGTGSLNPTDRSALLEKLHEQLQALGDDFEATGRKTIILVDGLDHIAREQYPERSLLSDLPLPSQIPSGVYFVVGSQTTTLSDLPPLVHRELNLPERQIRIGSLSPGDVESIAAEVVPELEEEGRQRLVELSAGHPLALIYIIKRLRLAEDKETQAAILTETVPYSDDIDAYYWSHWNRVQGDEALIHVLGLLARVRGAIGMDWAASWIERPVALRLEKVFGQYFNVDAANRWYFFHNSFRLFLQARTAQPILGRAPEELERSFHTELAELYSAADAPWRWEVLYHLYRANDYAGVVQIATTEWFRKQVQTLRPLQAIQGDVRLAIRSAGIVKDPLTLVRLTLNAAALEQQEFILDYYNLADLLLDLGDVHQALELIRDGDVLRVERKDALYLSVRLAEMGIIQEGARLFELAEPYDLLSKRPLSDRSGMLHRDTWDLLEAWAIAASRFRTPAEVLSIIEQLVVEPELQAEESEENNTIRLRRWLGTRTAIACASRGAWPEWKEYMHWLDEQQQGGVFEALLRSAESIVETDPEQSRNLLKILLEDFDPIPLNDDSMYRINARIDVVELALFLNNQEETVVDWINDLPRLPLQISSSRSEESRQLQESRFRLYRLKYWLGEVQNPDQLVKEDYERTEWGNYTKDNEKMGLRQLALMVTTLAALWGRGKRGQYLSSSAFLAEVRWILDLLSKSTSIDQSTWFRLEVRAVHPTIAEFLVQAAAEHGEEVIEALATELDRRWDIGEWSRDLRRTAIVALAHKGAGRLSRKLLNKLKSDIPGDNYTSYRAEEHWNQIQAWIELQDINEARAELRRMVTDSRGLLDDHDFQSEVWVRWMHRANIQDPSKAEERIQTMLRRLITVSGAASGIRDAAEELVSAAFHWSPRRAVHIMKGFQEHGVLSHDQSLSSLLRAALEVPDPPIDIIFQTLINLLVPLTSPNSPELVEILIEQIFARSGKDASIDAACHFVERVRAEALDIDRYAWLEKVEAGLEKIGVPKEQVGIDESELEIEEQKSSSSVDTGKLYLVDGTELTLAEACQIAQTATDFQSLVEKEDSKRTQYFRWDAIAEAAVERADSVKAILALADSVELKLNGSQAAKALAQLSRRASGMGWVDMAESLANRAIEQSEAVGWDRWWDGGSRIEALQALREVNSKEGQALAVKLYSEDLGGQFRSPQRLLTHFDEILPLLFTDIPQLDIWNLLDDYLDELYASVPVEPIPDIEEQLSKYLEETMQDNAAQGVADALAIYLDHPSYVVAAQAINAFASILVSSSETKEIEQALKSSITRSEAAAERVLIVLEAIAEKKPSVLESFRESLYRLMESQNLKMRVSATMLTTFLEGLSMDVPRLQCEIPSIYTLELPPLTVHRTEDAFDGRETPILLNDPARILRPLDMEAREVAKKAGVEEDAVLYRTVHFFEQLVYEHSWVTDADRINERRLQNFLDDTGLRVSFHKPHIEPAWRAVAHVAAELWDAGVLDVESAQQIVAMFFHHDSSLVLVEPEQRPSWLPGIGSLPADSRMYNIPEHWIERSGESIEYLHQRTSDGRIIIGELSRFAYLGAEERIEEERTSHIVAASVEKLWQEDSLRGGKVPFHRVINLWTRAYARIRAPSEHFVIAHTPYNAHTPGARWIAFNPRIAYELGWHLASEGNFRWVDETDNLAVESVWWRDGSLNRYDRLKDCQVGEGWLVLATEDAYARLVGRTLNLNRGGLVRRRRGFAASEGFNYSKALLPLV